MIENKNYYSPDNTPEFLRDAEFETAIMQGYTTEPWIIDFRLPREIRALKDKSELRELSLQEQSLLNRYQFVLRTSEYARFAEEKGEIAVIRNEIQDSIRKQIENKLNLQALHI